MAQKQFENEVIPSNNALNMRAVNSSRRFLDLDWPNKLYLIKPISLERKPYLGLGSEFECLFCDGQSIVSFAMKVKLQIQCNLAIAVAFDNITITHEQLFNFFVVSNRDHNLRFA